MTDQTNPTTPNPAPEEPKSKKSTLESFVEHQINAAKETNKAFQSLIPPDFRVHSRAARQEFLESFKVLIDGAATIVESELNKARQANEEKKTSGGNDGPSTTGKTKVKVEVS